jgi:outer membrane protein
MPGRTLLLTLLLAFAAAGRLAAQAPLTLDRAVAEALDRNPRLVAARAAEDRSDAGVAEARAAWLPRVSFADSWQRGNEPGFVFGALLSSRRFTEANFAIPQLNSPASLSLHRATLGVGQTLFDAGRTLASVAAARERRTMANADVLKAEADLELAVARTYAAVLRAQAAGETARAAVSAAEADLARAEHRRDAGTVTEADVLTAAVHLSDMRQREIQTAGDAAAARAELNRLMGAPIEQTYEVEEPAPSADVNGDLATLFAEADAARPDLARAAAAERVAEAAIRQARADWWPQVSAQAGVGLNGLDFADRASSWVVGADVRWNLSVGGAERARVRAAVAESAGARAMTEDARAAAHVEIVSALRRLESARARGEVARATVAQARESLRIIRDRYDAGLAAMNDVLSASTSLADADARRVDALVDAVVSQAELRHALGRTQASSSVSR